MCADGNVRRRMKKRNHVRPCVEHRLRPQKGPNPDHHNYSMDFNAAYANTLLFH